MAHDAEWDGSQYVVVDRKWRSTDGNTWIDSRGRLCDTKTFRESTIHLIGGPRDGETVA